MPTVDEQFDMFSDNINVAIEEWRKFDKYKAQIAKELDAFGRPGEKSFKVSVRKGGKSAGYSGNDPEIYSDLDATIEMADQSIERYMAAIHEMKATFDKAIQFLADGGEYNKTAETMLFNKDLVESAFSQAMAAKGAWDKGLSTVMPAYRKFKILSA